MQPSPLQNVSEGVGDRFILTNLVTIHAHFGSTQPPVSLEIRILTSLTRKVTEKKDDSFIPFQ